MRIPAIVTVGASLVISGTGCHEFLTGPSLGEHNPNAVTALKDPGALYVGLAAGQMASYTGQIGRFADLYMQQVGGAARQQQGYDLYVVGPGDVDVAYASFWAAPLLSGGGGGAADARLVQTIGHQVKDSIYVGLGKVWEAMLMGDAASIWGDVPYTQAFDPTRYPTPKYDPQMTVFNEVEQTLDSAIIYLTATPSATNLGPTGTLPRGIRRTAEIIYPGRAPTHLEAVYTTVAHTLKARYYLHMAGLDPANYAKALAEAQLGISKPADDFNWYANTAQGGNIWYQFQGARTDLAPAAALIHLMKARILAGKDIDNGRFTLYFLDQNGNPCQLSGNALQPDSGCTGIRPGFNTVLPYGEGNSTFSFINNDGSFNVPAVTFAETKLIAAEAALHAGKVAQATTFYNAVRTNEAYGADALDASDTVISHRCSPTCLFAAQPTVGAVTLADIMEEKYIDQFAEIEVWNDYKRTCLPSLAAAPSSPSSGATRAVIPGRLPYGQTAENQDPTTPNVGPTARNSNNPTACPTLTYTSTPAAW